MHVINGRYARDPLAVVAKLFPLPATGPRTVSRVWELLQVLCMTSNNLIYCVNHTGVQDSSIPSN